ncbi:pregnancy-associated plasma protein-A [Stackebrandtia albiflava]|uniref:Pregnancy-associated plasma protein-A n=1 Tax=Stackebrandtia albiflava TaxID=406432 RepID=A0A562VBG4_9ACTN|nr:zinc metalloprotease [Stackebrandtia albiflava]TWJ15225.1 pregnancy-associated plasma protein-A [Stackebrandtia albiflava]
MTDESDTVRWCATMPVHHRLLRTTPEYALRRRRIEEDAERRRRIERARRREAVTIPVVVHVVWNADEENVSDAQILSQLQVLNDDFNRANADVDTVPEPFRPLVAEARVRFRLAETDPQGAATTGVVRVRTDHTGFGPDDAVKSTATGGADAWPADRYLNVWVCRLTDGLLGYAQFPGGPAETDGVVVSYRAFGTTGTATAPFDGGRTTVHEVGHWLNLRHIWGDDGEGCAGSDFVTDTPNQAGPSSGVPRFPKVSCDNAPHGDLFVNFMDYSDDACTVMFTHGQAGRMDACLAGPRSSFAAASRPPEPVAEPEPAA